MTSNFLMESICARVFHSFARTPIDEEVEWKKNSYSNLTMFQGQTSIIMYFSIHIGRVCVPCECFCDRCGLMRAIFMNSGGYYCDCCFFFV